MPEIDYKKFWSPVFDKMKESVFIIDANLKLIMVNNSFLVFTDREEKDVFGRDACEVLYTKQGTAEDFACRQIFGSRIALRKDFYDQHLNKWLDVHLTPLSFGEDFIGSIVFISDVSEHKTAEKELKEVNELNQTLFNSVPFGIDIVDESGNIMFLNSALESRLGKEALGRKCWEVYREDKIMPPACPLIEGIDVGETRSIEVDSVFGGKKFQIFHTGMTFRDKKAILEVFIDITERKRTEENLLRAMHVKSSFVSMVSHELRTPLTAIKEGIAIVSEEITGALNEEQKEFLNVAKRNVDRLARLINDVLDFQKLESGRMRFDMRENSINEVIKEVHDMMIPSAQEKGLEFILDLDETLPKTVFDKDKINQVISNLVHNAIKYTEKGSITIISSVGGENYIKVAVRDTGKGIKQEDLPRLFRQFEQLEGIRERKTAGSGLGLVISRQIVEEHKGRIWADSEFGKGSIFLFILPIKERRG